MHVLVGPPLRFSLCRLRPKAKIGAVKMPPSRLLLVLCASLGGMFGETARAEPSAPGETVVTLIPATDAMLAV